MQTKKLFYEDPYLKTCSAKVTKIDKNKVYLDKTIFYPFAGGQVSDKGTINGISLIGVQYEGKDIAHALEKGPDFKEGATVECSLDWGSRYSTMKLHSASHIVMYFAGKVLGQTETTGSLVDSKKDRTTFSVKEKITPEQLEEIEGLTNKFMRENGEIKTWSDKKDPDYRYWKCGAIEMPCGGTHPRSVNEIGQIYLKRKGKGIGKDLVETYLTEKSGSSSGAKIEEKQKIQKPKGQFSGSASELAEKEHWPDHVAKKVIEAKGNLKEYTVAAGITPSGVVHIGNFREIMTVDLIAKALKKLGKKVRFIYSWDDYDVFRKVPANFPNKEMLEKYLRHPIVDVPDPFACHKSYAEHNEKVLEDELPSMGISPQFLHQAKKYRACEYAEGIKTALHNKEKIKTILDKWRAEDLEGEWSPVRVFCEKCNTDRTTITGYDGKYSLTYSCECGNKSTFDFRKKGIAKLQWRVDWPMRWSHEKVIFEPSGKEHSSEGGSNTTANEIAKEVWGFEPPYHIMYEFIAIKGTGGKMSSSKGNTVDLKEMKRIYEPEVIRYLFVKPVPSRSFEISFDADVINLYEGFDRLERVYFGAEEPSKENTLEQFRSIYEYSVVELPKKLPIQPSFRHITTVLQLNIMDEKKTYDYFKKDVKNSFDERRLATRISCAKNWLASYAPEQFHFAVQDTVSKAALLMPKEHKEALFEFAGKLSGSSDETVLGEHFKSAADKRKIPIADLFRSAYLVLLNKERGPKLFQIIENIGVAKVKALANELQTKKIEKKKTIILPGKSELRKVFDFEVASEIVSKHPALRIGVLVIDGLDNSGKHEEIPKLLRAEEAAFRQKYFGKDLSSINGIKSWREAYSSFGAKPKDYKSSIESLAKRVLKGDQLPSINPLVDLYNYISIKYVLPAGADDLSKVKGKIMLKHAKGEEQFFKIGSQQNEPPEKGEIVYADNEGILCRRWNWRECDRTKLTEHTKKAAVYIESLNQDDSLEEAVTELASILEKYCKAKVSCFVVQ
jgi:lysyl-tRNA synthetase class 1